MLSFRRLHRLTACLLLLCTLVLLFPKTATAESGEAKTPAGRTVSYVRLSAYSGSTIIGCLENGTRLTVLGTKNGFYRIDCYEMTGYIAASQVRQNGNGEYYVNCVEGSYETRTLPARSAAEALSLRGSIRTEALKYQGVPYVWGGTTPRGFDCSGFVQYVLGRNGLYVNRTCRTQLQNGIIIAKEDLQCGDLVFFQNTGDGGFASHIGIYIGNGQLIHAGSKGITVVGLNEWYFTYHYMCARRVVLTEVEGLTQDMPVPGVGITQNINGSYWRESSRTEASGDSFFAQKTAAQTGGGSAFTGSGSVPC